MSGECDVHAKVSVCSCGPSTPIRLHDPNCDTSMSEVLCLDLGPNQSERYIRSKSLSGLRVTLCCSLSLKGLALRSEWAVINIVIFDSPNQNSETQVLFTPGPVSVRIKTIQHADLIT
jgi:hypothetical protein